MFWTTSEVAERIAPAPTRIPVGTDPPSPSIVTLSNADPGHGGEGEDRLIRLAGAEDRQ